MDDHVHNHGNHDEHDHEDRDELEQDENLTGVFLHILADTLGSVGIYLINKIK